MIDPDDIEQRHAPCHAADPPGILLLFLCPPVIDRIAPQLAGCGKRVRRTACDHLRDMLRRHPEHLRMRPGVRTVERDIERNIADDLNPVFCCVFVQRGPLPVKQKLLETVEIHLLLQLQRRHIKHFGIALAVRILPVHPGCAVKMLLERTEQRIIIQPVRLLLRILYESRTAQSALLLKMSECCPQKRPAAGIDFAVIHLLRILSEVNGIAFVPGEQSFLDQFLRRNKIWIPGKRGERLIR